MTNIGNSAENINATPGSGEITQSVTAGEAAADFATKEIKLAALLAHVPNFAAIPKELKDLNNWVNWGGKTAIAGKVAKDKAETAAEVLESKLKGVKIPVNPSTGGNALPNEETTWKSFDKAKNHVGARECVGVGFMFDGKPIDKDLCYVGIDLDNCVDDDGKLTPEAQHIISELNSYTEFSPSVRGIHIICLAEGVGTGKRGSINGYDVEIYSQGRYFTMSGNVSAGFGKLRAAPAAVKALVRVIVPREAQKPSRLTPESLESLPAEFTNTPLPNGSVAVGFNAMAAGIPLKGEVAPDVVEVRSALAAIPKPEWNKTEPWNAIARGLAFESHHHPALKEELYAAFDESCKGVEKYKEMENRERFERFVREVPGYTGEPCTKATIFFEAGKHNWKGAPVQAQSQDAGAGASPGSGTALTGVALPFQYEKGSKLPKASRMNAKICLQAMKVRAWRDLFSNKLIISGDLIPPDYLGLASDGFAIWACGQIFAAHGFDPGEVHTTNALKSLAEDNRRNPITDGLDGLVWDRKPRLVDWLPRVTGCTDTPLHREFGKKLLRVMCLRARVPGTKYDTCLVLEGDQGIGKSKLARRLAGGGAYFTDATNLLNMPSKERGELLAGCWVAELPELGGLIKSQVDTVKQVITQQADHYRAAYGYFTKKQPRTCVFLATTNSTKYLEDTTGARRFECVWCKKIDIGLLLAERMQLFAEADQLVVKVIEAAVKSGWDPLEGEDLPDGIYKLLSLPPHLQLEADAASEKRRVIAHGEEFLAEWEQRYLADPKSPKKSNGRVFVPSEELRKEFQMGGWHTTPHPREIAGWMRKLGWEGVVWGYTKAGVQCRGFEKI